MIPENADYYARRAREENEAAAAAKKDEQAAAETTRMPMVFTDAGAPHHPIIFANDAFLSLTGYGREEVLGLAAQDHELGLLGDPLR